MKNRKGGNKTSPDADEPELSKQDRAQKAMFQRARKENSQMTQYYYVIAFFVVVCIASVLMTVITPKQNINEKDVIDQQEIFIHNG